MDRTSLVKRVVVGLAAVLALGAGSARAEETVDPSFVLNGDATKGVVVFKQYCAMCHGETGHGDGVASAALNPKPRNFTDKALMNAMSDQHIYTVIKEGGAAVGKSMFMTAWKALLTDQQIRDVGAYVRTLSAP